MLTIISLITYVMIETCVSQEIVNLPVTYYFNGLQTASTLPANALYYYASLCPKGINGHTIAVLDIYESENVEWNTTARPYVVVQVSQCVNSFTKECVVATNYQWGITVKAVPIISWKVDTTRNSTDYFIRAMGQYEASTISMELSFTNDINVTSFPWSTDFPFMSPNMNKDPKPLDQYWKSNSQYIVNDDAYKTFSIAYCNQGDTVKGVDIAITAVPNITDYSLMQQWACPQTVPVNQCTYSNSQMVGWFNQKIASFNLLSCNEGQKTTKNGLYVVVSGNGANQDKTNTFTLGASQQ